MPFDQNLKKEVDRLKSAVEELTVLNELALAASPSLDVDQVLDTIVQKSIKAVRAEQGSIMLVTPQQDKPLQTLIRKEDYSQQMNGYKVGANITGWVLKNKQPLIVENLATDDRFHVTEKEIGEIRTVVCVPIVSRAQIIGVLTLTNKKTGEPFTPNDLRLLSIIAAQSGQLIHNSELQVQAVEKKRLEHQLDLAKEIQQKLLPKADPQNESLEIASYFNPADAVGGDYFDYFNLGDKKIGIVIADVSGHGAPAALVMTLLKGVLHSIIHNFHSAEQVVWEINEIISKMVPDDMFVTMQFLVVDPDQKLLHIANAGHNPIIRYSSTDKKCHLEELQGCALNLSADFEYTGRTFEIKSNDIFLVYTDGINEAINKLSEMYTIPRLIQSVENGKKDSARAMVDYIWNEVKSFTSGSEQADDMVLIGLKIR